ncbi:sulfotransferase 1C2-like isoform X2 [Mytilus galloprovincialis]|uniref:sulfotransferase 1C2-like isoform X2 n=1 Tax=Mytilus galloprovincialis TaxID=29158 RepID=UPI003F7C0D74
MPLTDLTDSDGNHFKVLEVDGYYLPNFGYDSQESDFLKRVDHWHARDDDIMICNYPKSVDYKSWFDYVRDWCKVLEENKDYPIHVINYEDMHTNNIKEIKRLTEFLCIKCEDQLIGEIGTKCQIENMKREKIQNNEDWRDNTAGMYREGKVGGWKNVFTVTQNELFDEVYDKKMAGVDFNL